MEPKWKLFQDYIALKLREIDKYSRSTKGSGNKGEKGDVKTSLDLHFECKLRNTDSITINSKVWKKLNEEIPLHSQKIPVLALENKEGKKLAVLDLDDFLNLYIELYRLKQNEI